MIKRPVASMKKFVPLVLVLGLLAGATCEHDVAQAQLTYTRSGGQLGYDDVLTLYDDGRALIKRGGERRGVSLPEPRLVTLRALLDSTDIAKLQPPNPSGNFARGAADYMTYVLAHDGTSVTMNDTNMTEAAKPLIALLDRILEDYAGDLGPAPAGE